MAGRLEGLFLRAPAGANKAGQEGAAVLPGPSRRAMEALNAQTRDMPTASGWSPSAHSPPAPPTSSIHLLTPIMGYSISYPGKAAPEDAGVLNDKALEESTTPPRSPKRIHHGCPTCPEGRSPGSRARQAGTRWAAQVLGGGGPPAQMAGERALPPGKPDPGGNETPAVPADAEPGAQRLRRPCPPRGDGAGCHRRPGGRVSCGWRQ